MSKKVTYEIKESGTAFDRNDFYPGDIPAKPGVYIFRDRFSKIIYVGKASNLRKRMSSYFQKSKLNNADPKVRSLINSIAFFEFYPVASESESLVLESRFIKEYVPRYNVLMRDDKRFLMIKINLDEPYPTLRLARFRKQDGCKYFGPFPKTSVLRETVEFLIKRFKLKVCSAKVPGEKERKHCLARVVKDCCAPCTGDVTQEQYMENVNALMKVLNGSIGELTDDLKGKMSAAVEKRKYEKAALYRDMIGNVEEIFGGKKRSFRFAKAAGAKNPIEALQALQAKLYLPTLPLVIECFDISNISGSLAVASKVCFQDGKAASAYYRRFRIRGETPYEVLRRKKENSAKKEAETYPLGYGGDDCAMIAEAVARAYVDKCIEGKKMPDLIIIDGGHGQLNAAIEALRVISAPEVPIFGLAKKNEEVIVPNSKEPIILDKRSSELRLLQALRDEAHRFAISYHRQLRAERIQESLLDDIPGIGQVRRNALLTAFGSIKKLKKASIDEICEKVPGISKKIAQDIFDALH